MVLFFSGNRVGGRLGMAGDLSKMFRAPENQGSSIREKKDFQSRITGIYTDEDLEWVLNFAILGISEM